MIVVRPTVRYASVWSRWRQGFDQVDTTLDPPGPAVARVGWCIFGFSH
jgi:hypothetical protein